MMHILDIEMLVKFLLCLKTVKFCLFLSIRPVQ